MGRWTAAQVRAFGLERSPAGVLKSLDADLAPDATGRPHRVRIAYAAVSAVAR